MFTLALVACSCLLWAQGPAHPLDGDEDALVCMAEAKTTKELKACRRADAQREDSVHRALFLLRRYELARSDRIAREILKTMPKTHEELWRIYEITNRPAAQEHTDLGGAPYGYFTLLGQLVLQRGTHIASYLALCCYSDGEIAEGFWEWADLIRRQWPEEFQRALGQLDPSCRERATAANDS